MPGQIILWRHLGQSPVQKSPERGDRSSVSLEREAAMRFQPTASKSTRNRFRCSDRNDRRAASGPGAMGGHGMDGHGLLELGLSGGFSQVPKPESYLYQKSLVDASGLRTQSYDSYANGPSSYMDNLRDNRAVGSYTAVRLRPSGRRDASRRRVSPTSLPCPNSRRPRRSPASTVRMGNLAGRPMPPLPATWLCNARPLNLRARPFLTRSSKTQSRRSRR